MKIKLAILHVFICTLLVAQNTEQFTGSEDNVEFKAISDGDNIYLTLRTEFKETMQSLLHRGFVVYFDIKGKKKKNVSVQYPLKVVRPERGSRPDRKERGEENKNDEKKGPDIAKMVENLPKMANYTNYDLSQDFNLDMNNLGIEMNYSYSDDQEGPILEYHLKIPALKISDGKVNLSKLSIGIVSTKQEQNENQQNSNISIGGRQGGGQGGPPGGGGGRGGSGSRNGGGPPQERKSIQEESIDFWFKLYPKK